MLLFSAQGTTTGYCVVYLVILHDGRAHIDTCGESVSSSLQLNHTFRHTNQCGDVGVELGAGGDDVSEHPNIATVACKSTLRMFVLFSDRTPTTYSPTRGIKMGDLSLHL